MFPNESNIMGGPDLIKTKLTEVTINRLFLLLASLLRTRQPSWILKMDEACQKLAVFLVKIVSSGGIPTYFLDFELKKF